MSQPDEYRKALASLRALCLKWIDEGPHPLELQEVANGIARLLGEDSP